MAEYGKYKAHKTAARFPLLDEQQLNDLASDIKANKQQQPITLAPDGITIVDGLNRYRACEQAGVKPKFRKLPKSYTEVKIIDFIISANMRRRDLESGQKAMIYLDIAQDKQAALTAAAKERQQAGGKKAGRGRANRLSPRGDNLTRAPRVQDQLAADAGVGSGTMSRAKKVKDASPALAREVQQGKRTLNDAYKEVRRSEAAMPERESKRTLSKTHVVLVTHEGAKVDYRLPKGKPTFNRTNDQVSWACWTWNPVTGCLHNCEYCYSRALANKPSYAAAYPLGFTPLFHPERLSAPTNTEVPNDADADERLRRVFVCSMADLYGKWVPSDWIDQVHASCIRNPQWDYLLLTKFPQRYVDLQLPPTAWVGTTVDRQHRVKIAEEAFRNINNVRLKWLSLEPLLEPLEFSDLSMFDWIVIGSQSETRQPDVGIVPAKKADQRVVNRLIDQAHEAGCRVYCKPNLNGKYDPQSPGMELIQEAPSLPALPRAQGDLFKQQAAE